MQEETEPYVPATPKAKDVYIKVHNVMETMHSNQTGCFPVTSSKGNQYIIVLVEVDGNFIDAEPMKNRSEGSMIKLTKHYGHDLPHPEPSTTKHQQNSRGKYNKIAQYSQFHLTITEET